MWLMASKKIMPMMIVMKIFITSDKMMKQCN